MTETSNAETAGATSGTFGAISALYSITSTKFTMMRVLLSPSASLLGALRDLRLFQSLSGPILLAIATGDEVMRKCHGPRAKNPEGCLPVDRLDGGKVVGLLWFAGLLQNLFKVTYCFSL